MNYFYEHIQCCVQTLTPIQYVSQTAEKTAQIDVGPDNIICSAVHSSNYWQNKITKCRRKTVLFKVQGMKTLSKGYDNPAKHPFTVRSF